MKNKTFMRILASGMAAVMAAAALACSGGSKPAEQNGGQDNKPSETQTANSTKAPDSTPKSDLLGPVERFPLGKMYINVPSYQRIEEGYTTLRILHGVRFFALTGEPRKTVTTLQEAHDACMETFGVAMRTRLINELSITEDSTETVNGIEVYKFVGTLSIGRDTVYDAFAIGYSFMVDGMPYNIIGCVTDKEQKQEDIAHVTEVVEAMILTLRDKK